MSEQARLHRMDFFEVQFDEVVCGNKPIDVEFRIVKDVPKIPAHRPNPTIQKEKANE